MDTARIGKFDFSIAFEEPPPDKTEERRVEALTTWLLSQWDREHEEAEHGDCQLVA
jgi:hypothetical protein